MKITSKTVWFALAVLIQLVLLSRIPAGQIEALQSGRTIRLKAYAVDRDNIWSGAYLKLKYDISRPEPSTALDKLRRGTDVYVLLRRENGEIWVAEDVVQKKPEQPGEDRVFLKGKIQEDGTRMHTRLRRQPDGTWRAGSVVAGEPEPSQLESENIIVARAWLQYKSVAYGLENYFVPEDRREIIGRILKNTCRKL